MLDDDEWRLFFASYATKHRLSKELAAMNEEKRQRVWESLMRRKDEWQIGRRGDGNGNGFSH